MHYGERRGKSLARQILGIAAGVGAGLGLVLLFPLVSRRMDAWAVMLWGGALGGALSSLDDFARAGAALTRSQNRPVNLLVGLGIPVLLLVAVAWLLR